MTARPFAALLAVLTFAFFEDARESIQAQAPQPTQSTQAPPTFRSRADAVWLTAFVTDQDGNPVRGLTADDFEVLEQGRPRDITTFQEVNLPRPQARGSLLTGVEPDVRTNDHPPGRVYIFALAVSDPCVALKTRFLIKDFLTKHFGPHDIAAVTHLGRGLRTDGHEFTNNVGMIVSAVDKFSGGFDECVSDTEGEGRPGGAISDDFRELLEVLVRMEGRHKTLLYFSEYPGFDWFDVIAYRGGVRPREFEDALMAMSLTTRADLTIYPIDPRGLTMSMGGLERRMTLRAMGSATGGFATTGTNSFAENFERIAIESSSFYGIGFNSGYMKDDGRFVDVTLRVKRPGLTVRTREGYLPLTRKQREEMQRRPGPPSTGVLGALASPVATYAGVPLRVHAVPFRRSDKLAEVALTVETDASAVSFTEKNRTFTGRIDLRHLANDARQRVFPEIRARGDVTLDNIAYARASEHGMRFVSVFDFPPGRYQLRVASDSGGRTGGVVYDLEVPDFDGQSLTLSGVALTTARAALAPTILLANRGAQKPANCDNNSCTAPRVMNTSWQAYSTASPQTLHTLATGLPGPPTTTRQFSSSDVLSLYAEAYDNRSRVTRDREGAIVAVTTLYDARHTVMHRTMDEHRSPAGAAPAAYPIRGSVPLATLPPGDYVLEVAVAPYGRSESSVSRRVPIQIR